ncbi:MAG: HAD family hydrolase, partial [Candidatus Binatia bacterium]
MTAHISGAIFDLDGLLVDTESVYDRVIQMYAQKMAGAPLPDDVFRTMRARMFGRKPEDSAALLHDTLGLSQEVPASHYLEWRRPILDRVFPGTDLLPGASRLVDHLVKHNVPIAIATSSQRRMVELKLQRHPQV